MEQNVIQDAGVLAGYLREEVDQMPNVKFKPEVVDIAPSANAIIGAIDVKTESSAKDALDKPALLEQVLSSYNSLRACPEHTSYFEAIRSLSSELGTQVTNIFNTLTSVIAPDVEQLINSIKERAHQILLESGNEVVANESLECNFNVMQWSKYFKMLGGIESINSVYQSNYGYPLTYGVSDLTYVMSKVGIKDIHIHPETKEDILARVMKKAGNAKQRAAVTHFFEMLTDSYSFNTVRGMTLNEIAFASSLGTGVKNICKCLENLRPAAAMFKATPLDITDKMRDDFAENMKSVDQLFNLMGAGLAVARKNYEHALVIDNDMLNGDVAGEFEEAGGTQEDVAKYMRAAFRGQKMEIPALGIDSQTILENKEQVNATYDLESAAKLKNAESIQASAMTQAATEVLEQYLYDVPESSLAEGETKEQFISTNRALISTHVAQLNASADKNLSSMLFSFIINLLYRNTMIGTAHEILGAELIKQAELTNEMGDETIDLAKAVTAAKIISKFITENLLQF